MFYYKKVDGHMTKLTATFVTQCNKITLFKYVISQISTPIFYLFYYTSGSTLAFLLH